MSSKKWMLIAVFCICIMAIAIKEVSDVVTSFQIIFFRSLIGVIVLLLFFRKRLQKPTFSGIKEHSIRNVFHILGQYGWIVGILYLPLAEVTVIEFSVPIWVLIIATIVLKEKLTVYKILSILLGFLGVLLMINFNISGVSLYSMIVLLSAISYGVTHTATKKLTSKYKSLDIVFIMCLVQVPISFLMALFEWGIPTLRDLGLLLIIGVSAITAHFTMSNAMKSDDVGAVMSLDYLRLPVLISIGVLWYNEEFQYVYLFGGILILLGGWVSKKR